jgi:hypothetical protein
MKGGSGHKQTKPVDRKLQQTTVQIQNGITIRGSTSISFVNNWSFTFTNQQTDSEIYHKMLL